MKKTRIIMIAMVAMLAFAFITATMAQTSTTPAAGTQKQGATATQPAAKPATPAANPTEVKQAAPTQTAEQKAVQPASAKQSETKTGMKSTAPTQAKAKKGTKKEAAKAAAKMETSAGKDIATTLIGLPDAKMFTTDLEKSDLFAMLKNAGPFTVFVPSDGAFAKLSKGAKDSLESDQPRLIDVLKYHIVRGKQDEASLLKASSVMTTDKRDVTVMNHDGKVMIGDAWVTKADIQCSNGVIHIIDSVLEPPAKGETMPMGKTGGTMPGGK